MENRSDISKNFIPYELALKLKELGFNNKSLGFSYMKFNCEGVSNAEIEVVVPNYLYNSYDLICSAPLWQQAFDWFREEKDLYADIYRTGNLFSANIEDILMGNSLCEVIEEINYEEARQACLEKLIELCENNQYHLK